ncbi:MAG: glycine cleavage system aminomethyltransferase GcvT [Methylococcaceae bacterium]|nr:glycine cleavage system aminomethyltransferase GcvT [Methylococcaceae bacterium]
MLRKTPLYQLHLELCGKITEFAGYLLPVHYLPGIIHEHLHCRRHAGFFDISHMGQLLIVGDEAFNAFEPLTPSDISGLSIGQQKYTVLTNDQGGVIDDIILTRTANGLNIIVNAACKTKDLEYLQSQLSDRCEVVELSNQALFALQGPAAAHVMGRLAFSADLAFMTACNTELAGISCTISRSGYTGEDGFEISVSNKDAEALARRLLAEPDVMAIGLGARDSLRLEAGLCLYGHELNETITPVEAGLAWLIKTRHPHFPGADRIISQLQDGPETLRVGLSIHGKQLVRDGSIIYNDTHHAVGHVTSGSFSPSLGKPIAMAQLDVKYSAIGTDLYTKVRERPVAVSVTRLPFIPLRYHR